MQEFSEQEAQLERHIERGETDEAIQCLLQLVQAYSKKKQFRKAEALRDRLYQIDPMAIREIVNAGDIIEQEKSASLDKGHLERWTDLYSRLTGEERNELYFQLHPISFQPDQALFRTGQENTHLFFLEQGEVKLLCRGNGEETYLKTCLAGDILGGETCFRIAARSTYSAISRTDVQASLLHQDALERWKQELPNLRTELYEYCFRDNEIAELLTAKSADRRSENRLQIQGRLMVQVLTESGKPLSRPFASEVLNISSGGLAFSIKAGKSETVHMLLSRRIALKTDLPTQKDWREIKKAGRIVAVWAHAFNEHSLHVQFEKPLPQDLLESLQPEASRPGQELELG